MRSKCRRHALRALHMIGVITCLCGCTAQTEDPGADELSASQQAFQNNLKFVNCGTTQINKLQAAANYLSDQVYRDAASGMNEVMQCIEDAFIIDVYGGLWGRELYEQLTRGGVTTIRCIDSVLESCAGNVHDWWGCAGRRSTEDIMLANHFINDPKEPIEVLALVMAHELMHNYGHRHDTDEFLQYSLTVPAQVAACVNGAPNYVRRSVVPYETELSPVGRNGGVPYDIRCPYGFVPELSVGWNSKAVISVGFACSQVGVVPFIGTLSGTDRPADSATDSCPVGQKAVGVYGRADSVVRSIGLICGSRFGTRTRFELHGPDKVGRPFARNCPSGMAISEIRARIGDVVHQVGIVCQDRTLGVRPGMEAVGQVLGRQTGTVFRLQCAGMGALVSLLGRADKYIRRIGGICHSTKDGGGNLPILTGNVHPTNFVGGFAGTDYRQDCPAGQAMVGINVRFGSRVDAIGGICADTAGWAAGLAPPTALNLSGGKGGTQQTDFCPNGQFLSGLQVWDDGSTRAVQIMCRSLD